MKLEKVLRVVLRGVYCRERIRTKTNLVQRARNRFSVFRKNRPRQISADYFAFLLLFLRPAIPRFRGHGTCSSVSDMGVAYRLSLGAYQTREILSAAYCVDTHACTRAYVYAISQLLSRSTFSFLSFASFSVYLSLSFLCSRTDHTPLDLLFLSSTCMRLTFSVASFSSSHAPLISFLRSLLSFGSFSHDLPLLIFLCIIQTEKEEKAK